MTWWEGVLAWAASWNTTQGFWTAVQGVGTLVAAIAALVALFIARSQLSELIRSNKLLASSNDSMTDSNVAATRPYIVVDYAFRPVLATTGGSHSVSLAVKIENTGRSPAKNLKLKLDIPFESTGTGRGDYSKSIAGLNGLMDGETEIKSLSPVNPMIYFVGDSTTVESGKADGERTIVATYENAEGRRFTEIFTLELEHWKLAIIQTDPLQRIAKNLESLTGEVKRKPVPKLVMPPTPKPQMGRPALRRFAARRRRSPR